MNHIEKGDKSYFQLAVEFVAKIRNNAGYGLYNAVGATLHVQALIQNNTGRVVLPIFASMDSEYGGPAFMKHLDAFNPLKSIRCACELWTDYRAGKQVDWIKPLRLFCITVAHALCLGVYLGGEQLIDLAKQSTRFGSIPVLGSLTKHCSLSTAAAGGIMFAFTLWAIECSRSAEKFAVSKDRSGKLDAQLLAKRDQYYSRNLLLEVVGIGAMLLGPTYLIPKFGVRTSTNVIHGLGLFAKTTGLWASYYGDRDDVNKQQKLFNAARAA